MTTADLHMLAGAYAVHALEPDEEAQFDRHLAQCASCAEEVREFRATAERLGLAVAETPPAELRERVLREIRTERQEPPVVGETGRGRARWRRPGRAASRFALAAAVAAAAALGGVAVWQYERAQDAQQQADRAQVRAQQVAAVLTAPDARATTSTLTGGVTATVVESHGLDRAVFLTSGLPALPGDRTYQLWFDDAGTMRPAGFVTPAAADQAVVLEGRVGGAVGMGVTVEPHGGSAQPTSVPLALMSFPKA